MNVRYPVSLQHYMEQQFAGFASTNTSLCHSLGEVLEESRLNLEDMELAFDSPKRVNPQPIKTEPPWSPAVSLDTGMFPYISMP